MRVSLSVCMLYQEKLWTGFSGLAAYLTEKWLPFGIPWIHSPYPGS